MARVYWLLSNILAFPQTGQSECSDLIVVQENLQKRLITLQLFLFFLGIYNRDLHVTLFPAPMFYWSLPLFLWPLRDPRHPKALVRLTAIMAFQTPSAPNIPYQCLIAG